MIIAIDGYVATGKGTTAQGVADILGFTYIDTGAMYRAAAWYAREHDLLSAGDDRLADMLDEFSMEFVRSDDGEVSMYIDGINRESEIRSTDLALVMRPVVISRPLRERMVQMQRILAQGDDVVGDGRDMGTVVFPDADYKFFLTCDLDVRVDRRARQLTEKGLIVDREKIRREIILRDETDYLGPNPVNTRADDAEILDTTDLLIADQIDYIVQKIRRDGSVILQ